MKKNIAGSLPPVLLPRVVRSAEHLWVKLSGTNLCQVQSTCSRCGATDGENKEHTPNEDDGDCTTAITCSVCGTITAEAKKRR